MPQITREELRKHFVTAILPGINVSGQDLARIVDDVHFCFENTGDAIGGGLPGVMMGITEYVRFTAEMKGIRFSPDMPSDMYGYGLNCIQQGIQALALLARDEELRRAYLELERKD